ncbi:MAG: dihydroorotase [Alphaproteobacteria bacterium]|nr:dihydroorotase [Alphaproteobacteria bacterium]
MTAKKNRTAYVNARLLDPASGLDAKGALLTEGGEILDLGPKLFADGVPDGIERIDCQGHCLAPGLIDARVQLREPGYEHKETMTTASLAAASGGVTTMLCLPNTDPVIDGVALVELVKRRALDAGLINVHPYAALTQGLGGEQITEMGLLAEAGAVAFTDGIATVANAMTFRRALDYARTFDLLIVQHPEDPALANGGVMNEGELATRLGLAGIPTAAETILVERDLRLLELTGGRYHAAHLSTADAIEAVRRAKKKGLNVTCETAPPYFALNETAVGDYRTFAKLSPPLRDETDREAVIEGLKDGTIDLIASDHAPHDQDSKRLPFVQAENGIVGLETLLPLTLELVHNGSLPLLRALEAVTVAPARVFRLAGGVLAKGKPADLVLFDLEKPWKIDVERFRSKSKNSPFDGRPVQGVVLRTVAAGQPAFVQE